MATENKDRGFELFEDTHKIQPFRWAFLTSMLYFVICLGYIWGSGKIAKSLAVNTDNLYQIEMIKGFIFVFFTSVLIFVLLFFLFKHVVKQQEELIAQKHELFISQRQALAGIFASSIAHDINNVLTILDYHWYLLTNNNKDIVINHEIQMKFEEAIKDLQILSQRLMNIGKQNIPSKLEVFDLVALTKQTIHFLRKYREVSHCKIEYKGEEQLKIEGVPTICRQLLVNLILNAGRSIEKQGHIRVELLKQQSNAVLQVHDNGPGIPKDDREKIFKAFYSTQPQGTGLGLTSIKVYVDVLGGQMNIAHSDLGGACFRIEIPL